MWTSASVCVSLLALLLVQTAAHGNGVRRTGISRLSGSGSAGTSLRGSASGAPRPSAIVEIGYGSDDRQLAVATLHAENGTVADIMAPFGAPTSGESGSCNAVFDASAAVIYKTSTDGKMLTVSALTGKVVNSVVMSGAPDILLSGGGPFLAGPDSRGLLYTAAPLERTSYTIFSFNVTSGEVSTVSTQPKGQLDGLGVCAGFVHADGLYYVFRNNLVRYSLAGSSSSAPAQVTPYFAAPVALDPSRPGSLLAVLETGNRSAPQTALARISLASGKYTTLYNWNMTFYQKLCHCQLPIRAQDQHDLTVSADGSTVWAVLSYNSKPKDHKSGIARGMFVLRVGADGTSATLASQTEVWSESDLLPRPHMGSLFVQP